MTREELLAIIEEVWAKRDTSLDLSGKLSEGLPPEIGKLTDLTALRLSQNQLIELPSEIGSLTKLTALDLRRNQLTELPPEIGNFTHLTTLNLNGNQLTELPPEIGNLTELTKLTLDGNQLTELPPEIGKLTNLKTLHLYGNSLNKLPPEIGKLVCLNDLILGTTQLEELPPEIGDLTVLTELYAFHNPLRDLPPEIGKLTNLRHLDLDGTSLARLPPEIGQLVELTTLLVGEHAGSSPDLKTLPAEIGSLTKLTSLYLRGNQLTGLPPEIGNLTKLKSLRLSENQLTRLPPEIGNLTVLESLNLSENQLTELPPEIDSLTNLTSLGLHGNDLGIPQSVLQESRPADILAYYFENLGGSAPLNEIKLLLVGRGGAGKSSIRDRLIHDTFDPKKAETPGIEIDDWSLNTETGEVCVHVWDFAGQQITHATHQFFLTERSVYVVVLDARADTQDQDAEYWLRIIRAFGGDSPVIVVLNKIKDKPFEVDRFALQDRFPTIVGFVETDCGFGKHGFGITDLERLLRTTIEGVEEVGAPFPTVWSQLKKRFGAMRKKLGTDYINFDDFREECGDAGEEDPVKQERLARVLHALGVILHFVDDRRLRDTTVLNPHWVTNSAYKLLRLKEGPKSKGVLSYREARRALPDDKPKMVRYILDLLCRFELCFPLEGKTERWLVPEVLPRFQPPLGEEWKDPDALRLRYRYPILPEGVIPRLITRTYPLSEGEEVVRWRGGVILTLDEATALVRAEANAATVHVVVKGGEPEARLRLATLVREQFAQIHGDVPGLSPVEDLEIDGRPGHYKRVSIMEADERLGQTTTIETDQGTQEIDRTRELDRISSPSSRTADEGRLRLFLSYAHEDAKLRDVFRLNLDLMKRDGLVDWWFDGKILPSAEWDAEIRHEIEQADVIVFLVSTALLASDYVQGVEMKLALERRAAGEAEIVSVITEDCRWKGRPFTKYQVIQPDGRPVRRHGRLIDAFNLVEAELCRLVEDVRER